MCNDFLIKQIYFYIQTQLELTDESEDDQLSLYEKTPGYRKDKKKHGDETIVQVKKKIKK